MAKVKGDSNKSGSTTSLISKTATPVKASGKVRKLRINVRDIRKLNDVRETSRNSVESGPRHCMSNTRTCFVKLPCTRNICNTGSNNNTNVFQGQCEVDKNKRESMNEAVQKTITKTGKVHANDGLISADAFRRPINEDFKGIVQRKESRYGHYKTNGLGYESTSCALKNITAIQNIKIVPRECCVRLKRTTIEKTRSKNNYKNSGFPDNRTMKRCVVKLRRNPMVTEKTKPFISEPLVLNPVNNKTGEEILKSISCPKIVTVIDDVKRNNFHKLSLTKSLRKQSDNEEHRKATKMDAMTSLDNINDHEGKEQEAKSVTNEVNLCETQPKNMKTVNLKHVPKLSLKISKLQKKRNIARNSETTLFDPQQNSTICFEPARNSTLMESKLINKDKKEGYANVENDESTSKNISTKNRSSNKNLANKSEEIENLLNSLDDKEDNQGNTKALVAKVQNHSTQRPNKFFHRQRNNSEELALERGIAFKLKPTATKKHRLLRKRSTHKKIDNIYEFLSQSQTSDSDSAKRLDPAADIIKKLIDQGKVCVATNYKGKGKPKLKRNAPIKRMTRIKKNAGKSKKQLKPLNSIKNKDADAKEKENKYHAELENHEMDEVEDGIVDDDYDVDNQRHGIVNNSLSNDNNKHYLNEKEGTFSRLARSVLINQTDRSNVTRRKNNASLLEIVKQFVSTPKNKKDTLNQTASHLDLSPIAIQQLRPATKASPWRVDEDSHLPRTFNFCRSSGNLPSFSSDFIPSTPRKEKSKKTITFLQTESVTNNDQKQKSDSELPNNTENIQQLPSLNALSSFSSNDSNAENMPPPEFLHSNNNENDNIFNLKQLPNPRRTLNNRSPLKGINILEVVHLPPIKNLNKNLNIKDVINEIVKDSLQVNQCNIVVNDSSKENSNKKAKACFEEDIFGFEDFLSQTSEISNLEYDNINPNDISTNGKNQTMHEKLQELRKLKPTENEMQLDLLNQKSKTCIKTIPLFVDALKEDVVDGMRQRGIEEMLCSTMIHPHPSTSEESLKLLKRRHFRDAGKINYQEVADISELFKDPDPEVTFNENDAHRTYIRPQKRKRRLRENNYVMFLDTDESEDEHISAEHQKHVHSHETDTSSESAPKKKRHRNEPKEKKELTEFVEEFNKMCKEIDNYKLIVEKST